MTRVAPPSLNGDRLRFVLDNLGIAVAWLSAQEGLLVEDVYGHLSPHLDELTEIGRPARSTDRDLYPLLSDTDAETLPAPEWGIQGIYPHGGFVVVFSPRGVGKTFLVLGWAFGHGTGLGWLGRAARQGPVVYIMGEGRGGIGVRVRAQKEHLGIDRPADVHFITTAVPMLNDTEVSRLVRSIEALGRTPSAVVWDTLSRTMIGGDENSSRDMATYVAAVDRVKEAVGGTAIVQHHAGHGSVERERGSSVLGGAADTIISLRDTDGFLQLECEKQKDASEFAPIALQRVKVGPSCVLLLHDEAWTNSVSVTQVERQALRVLHESFLADGASTTTWLKTSKMPESSFYKARTSLVKRGFVNPGGKGRAARNTVTPDGTVILSLHNSTEAP